MKKQIIKNIIEVLKSMGYKSEEYSENTNLFKDIGIDSLDAIELVTKLEEEYNVTIPDDQINNITTIGSAADLVCKYLKD
jgi:acyl carrier protein